MLSQNLHRSGNSSTTTNAENERSEMPVAGADAKAPAVNIAGAKAGKDAEGTSLLRALAILELIAHKSGGFTNAEISRRLKIATSTTSYILSGWSARDI